MSPVAKLAPMKQNTNEGVSLKAHEAELIFDVPVSPIKDHVVTLCALSAHLLPAMTTLSNPDSCPDLACAAAALNLAIFC